MITKKTGYFFIGHSSFAAYLPQQIAKHPQKRTLSHAVISRRTLRRPSFASPASSADETALFKSGIAHDMALSMIIS